MVAVTNPEESIQAYRRRLDGVAYSTYILIMLLVPLKIWSRKRSGGWQNIRLDDYMSIVALAVANGFFYTCIVGMRKSLGLHVTEITDPKQIVEFLKLVFIGQIFYVYGISAIKFSVIAFYWRLFAVNARVMIYFVTFLAVGWLITLNFLVIFACIPVKASWDPTFTGAKCIELRSIYLGGSVPNVITDVILVLMPIPYVWRLHAPLAQRIVLAGMFALGTFIAIVSLVRLIIFLQIPIGTAGDVTYNFREIIVWSIVEINIGLTCACLPSLKPVLSALGLSKLFSFTNSRPSNTKSPGPSSNFPSRGRQTTEGSSRPRKKGATGGMFSTLAGLTKLDSEEDGFKIIDDVSHGKNHTEIEMTRLSNDSSQKNMGGISVQKDWSVFIDEKKDGERV